MKENEIYLWIQIKQQDLQTSHRQIILDHIDDFLHKDGTFYLRNQLILGKEKDFVATITHLVLKDLKFRILLEVPDGFFIGCLNVHGHFLANIDLLHDKVFDFNDSRYLIFFRNEEIKIKHF